MANKNTFISLSLITVIGLSAWTMFSSYRPQTVTTVISKQAPDAFMENVTSLIMGKDGKLSMKIVTPKMVHYSQDDTTDLSSPQLTLYRKSPVPWLISSQFATATQGVDNVYFRENVIIKHDADASSPATLIKTPTLLVHPNKQTAETNDLITMVQPNFVVKAVGMLTDMNTGDVKLLSQTRGEYAPDS